MRNAKLCLGLAGMMLAGVMLVDCVSAGAQAGAMPAMDGMQMIPPPDQLPAPVRMTGIGNSHITIKANAEAQVWFDQGLSLLHDFWDYESARAFEQAVRTDPNCAMCNWGLAQALMFRGMESHVYADKALSEAVRLEGKASKTDRLYIDAAVAESHEKENGHGASIAVYRKLVKKAPQDIEACIFLSNALRDGFDEKGEPKAGEKESIAILEGVLKDAPNDSAANHYWIHAMEPSNHPERAIPSSALLASLAPTSGHMVHMPGHIYYRVGDYASADHWFTASIEADEHYMHEQHVSVDDDWNYPHNMMYAIANQMEQGRLEAANALSDRLAGARGQVSATLYIWNARDQISRVGLRLPVALRVGDWDGVLAILDNAKVSDEEKTANLHFLKDELRAFAKGMRALDHGDAEAAQSASAGMDAGLWRSEQSTKTKLDADAAKPAAKPDAAAAQKPSMPLNPDAVLDPLTRVLSVASMELRAGVLLQRGKTDDAKKLYAEAIAAEKKLGYHEPPLYIRPVAETEGEALLRAKDYAGAKTAYQAALVVRPQSGFELYGIARADELAVNTAAAQAEYRAFLKAWPSADGKLPEVVRAHDVLGDAGTVAAAK